MTRCRALPLAEREAAAKTTVAALRQWWHGAMELNRAAPAARGGAALLNRELGWLLDDATVGPRRWLDDEGEEGGRVDLRCEVAELERQWQRRLDDAVPLQYIVRGAPWRDHFLYVEEGACLIPRPETEQLIEHVLELEAAEVATGGSSSSEDGSSEAWVDLGTGSGCIALALANELPSRPSVVALDASDAALDVAAINCERLDAQHAVALRKGDLRDLASVLNAAHPHAGRCRGVVSNPPYIECAAIAELQAEVARHEPHAALDGGADGGAELLFAAVGAAEALLERGGLLALETGAGGQAECIVAHLEGGACAASWRDAHSRADYAGFERFVFARRA